MECVFASHIKMQVISQGSWCSDGFSIPGMDLIWPFIDQLRSKSKVSARSVNHPVSVYDGDAAPGLQGWRNILMSHNFRICHFVINSVFKCSYLKIPK